MPVVDGQAGDRVVRADRRQGTEELGNPERGKGCASAQRENFGHAKL
jgi:hypothetical protein